MANEQPIAAYPPKHDMSSYLWPHHMNNDVPTAEHIIVNMKTAEGNDPLRRSMRQPVSYFKRDANSFAWTSVVAFFRPLWASAAHFVASGISSALAICTRMLR